VPATSGIDGGGKLIVVAGEKWTGPLCLPVLRRVPFVVWLLGESLPDQSTPLGLAICSLTISAYGRAGVQRSLGETELGKIVLLLDQRCSLN
jgi:hypothetical protein